MSGGVVNINFCMCTNQYSWRSQKNVANQQVTPHLCNKTVLAEESRKPLHVHVETRSAPTITSLFTVPRPHTQLLGTVRAPTATSEQTQCCRALRLYSF